MKRSKVIWNIDEITERWDFFNPKNWKELTTLYKEDTNNSYGYQGRWIDISLELENGIVVQLPEGMAVKDIIDSERRVMSFKVYTINIDFKKVRDMAGEERYTDEIRYRLTRFE